MLKITGHFIEVSLKITSDSRKIHQADQQLKAMSIMSDAPTPPNGGKWELMSYVQ